MDLFKWNLRYTVGIWNLINWNQKNIWNIEDQILNGPFSMSWAIYGPNHSKSGHFCADFKWFLTKSGAFVRFQRVGLLDFRSHSKSRPLANQPLFYHSKYGLVQTSDPYCISANFAYCSKRMESIVHKGPTQRGSE